MLTGGSVSFGRTVNIGDFNSKKAEATIGFDNIDDLKRAEAAAAQAVADLLGDAIVTAPSEKKARKAKPEIKPDVEDAVIIEEIKPAISTGEERVEIFDDIFTPEAPPVTDKDLTDAINRKVESLHASVRAKGGDKDAVSAESRKVRTLLAKFVVAPKKAQDMPASVRPDFLVQLEALVAG